jgi:PAS domain S-box-containing protein
VTRYVLGIAQFSLLSKLLGRRIEVTFKPRKVSDYRCHRRKNMPDQPETALVLASIVAVPENAIIATDLNGIITSWNKRARRIFGHSAEEVLGEPISILIPADRSDETEIILQHIRSGLSLEHYETKRKHKDGRELEVSVSVSPIRDSSGEIIGASRVVRDITARKRLERESLHLAAIVENSDDAIVSKDLNGIIMSWNKGAERMFGYLAEEVVGKPISILAPFEGRNEMPIILDRIRRGQRVEHYETIRRRKDGTFIPVSLTVSPVRDASGTIIGASKIARDITERKRTEAALEYARAMLVARNDELKRVNAELEQFTRTASHDLREPLRNVALHAEVLGRHYADTLDESGRESLSFIVDSARRMQALIQDLLAYARTTGVTEEPRELIDSNEALSSALTNLSEAIRESAAEITHEHLPRLRIHRLHLEQLFQNLIGNAIKYKKLGPPRIHVSAELVEGRWRFAVRDNGIGISDPDKTHIFDAFKRLHSAARYPGTGIGLAICRKVVERYDGTIWVESEPGKGSTFLFTFPAATPLSPSR